MANVQNVLIIVLIVKTFLNVKLARLVLFPNNRQLTIKRLWYVRKYVEMELNFSNSAMMVTQKVVMAAVAHVKNNKDGFVVEDLQKIQVSVRNLFQTKQY